MLGGAMLVGGYVGRRGGVELGAGVGIMVNLRVYDIHLKRTFLLGVEIVLPFLSE